MIRIRCRKTDKQEAKFPHTVEPLFDLQWRQSNQQVVLRRARPRLQLGQFDLVAPFDGLMTPVRVDDVHDPGALLLLLAVLVGLVGRVAQDEVVLAEE